MAADAAEALGLEIPQLEPETQAALRAFLPPEASTQNPVDMIASASSPNYLRTLEIVLESPSVDAVILVSVPPVLFDPTDLMVGVTEIARKSSKPVLTVFMAPEAFYETVHDIAGHPPLYRFPESAVRALWRMCRQAEWMRRPVEEPATFDDVDDARVREVLDRDAEWLDPEDVRVVLDAYRIPVAAQRLVSGEAEVGSAARAVGFPCVLKAFGQAIVHKSDIGGVLLDLEDEASAVAAARAIRKRAGEAGRAGDLEGFLVQRQLAEGREVLVGAFRDPQIGPVVGFGMGGRYVEALRDVAFRIVPLTPGEARDLVRAIRGARILAGMRGEPPVDHAALEQILLRVGQLMTRHPRIAELDLNPVIAQPEGAPTLVADARIRLGGPSGPDQPKAG
jgi:acetyltransferase